MAFRISPKDAKNRLEELILSLESIELFMRDAGYNQASEHVLVARSELIEALQFIPKTEKKDE